MKKHRKHIVREALSKLDIKKPVMAKNVKHIRASYDTWTEWKQDPVGYWLFRVNKEHKDIHAGFCRKNNVISVVVTGTDGEAIYNTIVKHKLVKSMQHAAYMGYELQKAELALKYGLVYVQDAALLLKKRN